MATIVSPIDGTVVNVMAAPGDAVSSGDTVVVVESMKMEIPVASEVGGKIRSLLVGVGDTVNEGTVVATLE